MQPETVDAFHARILEATDEDGRLPANTDAMAGWDIYPYEPESLRMHPVRPLMDEEPARFGEDPETCWCADPTNHRTAMTVWTDGRWRVELDDDSGLPLTLIVSPLAHCDLTTMPDEVATRMGPLLRTLAVAVEALPSVGCAHVYKYGDGAVHLHLWVLGRPAKSAQVRGSTLMDWNENLPTVPLDVLRANSAPVVAALVAKHGGRGLLD